MNDAMTALAIILLATGALYGLFWLQDSTHRRRNRVDRLEVDASQMLDALDRVRRKVEELRDHEAFQPETRPEMHGAVNAVSRAVAYATTDHSGHLPNCGYSHDSGCGCIDWGQRLQAAIEESLPQAVTGYVDDVLDEVAERISLFVAAEMGSISADYADGWRDAAAAAIAEVHR